MYKTFPTYFSGSKMKLCREYWDLGGSFPKQNISNSWKYGIIYQMELPFFSSSQWCCYTHRLSHARFTNILEVVLQKDQSVSLRKVFFFFTPDYSVSFVILLKATISQIPELRELCCQLSTHQRNEQDPALTGPQVWFSKEITVSLYPFNCRF